MKWQLILLMVILIVPIVYGIEDCPERITNPGDIPCLVITSWQYPNACNTYTVKVFNSTPSLIDTKTMGVYGDSGRCNITFNYTTTGSYLMNFSSGDSAAIIVEADEMSYITIGIMLAVITFIFAYLSVQMKHWYTQIFMSLFTLIMVMYDFFISARIIETIESSSTGIASTLDTFFFIAVQFFRLALVAATIYVLYYSWKYVILAPLRKRESREGEDLYG